MKCYISVKGVLQTAVMSGNHKNKFAVLLRLLTQTKEAPKKKTVRVTNTKKDWFKHNISIAQQLITIYNTLCIRTKSAVALNVVKL